MSALLGGFQITDAAYAGPLSLRVKFLSVYTDRFHQLYAGRTLIGVSASLGARVVIGVFPPAKWPEEIQLVAVTPDDHDTDFGAALPPRPYNRVKLGFTTAGWAAAGAEQIEITAGDVPGGAVDPNHLVARTPFDTDRPYAFVTPPLEGSGTWNFAIGGRDGTKPQGNLGPTLAASARIDAHPPDVLLSATGNRLTAGVSAGNLNVSFAYDW